MVITEAILNDLSAKAKGSPRLRQSFDMRNSSEDLSQRMLNAIEPGTALPIHRHRDSSVTIICIRGHFEEYYYDDNGNLIETIDMRPGIVLNMPAGQWHSINSLESGTVILEVQDGKWEPRASEDILEK